MIDSTNNTFFEPLLPVEDRGSGTVESAAFDLSAVEGDVHLLLDARNTSGTNPTWTLTVEHRAEASDPWSAVPAAALYDPATGQTAAFTPVGTTPGSQRRALRRDRLKAQLRVVSTIGGTSTPKFSGGVYVVAPRKYAAGWDQ